MKLTCPISGIDWQVTVPASGKGSAVHPMLAASLSPSTLAEQYLSDWAAGQLTDAETLLLGLAFSLHLPLVELPALTSRELQDTFLLQFSKHMQKLAEVSALFYSLSPLIKKRLPQFRFSVTNGPSFADYLSEIRILRAAMTAPITKEARRLNSASAKTEDTVDVESLILRGLRGSPMAPKEQDKFVRALTSWVERTAPFPTTTIVLKGKRTTLCAMFREIMTATFSKAGAYTLLGTPITGEEVDLLLMHLYDNLDSDSVQGMAVIKEIRETMDTLNEFRSPTFLSKNAASILLDPPSQPGQSSTSLVQLGASQSRPVQSGVAVSSLRERLAKIRSNKND